MRNACVLHLATTTSCCIPFYTNCVQVSTSHAKDKAQSPAFLPASPTELTQPDTEAEIHAAAADELSALQGGISSSPNLPDVV